MNALATFQQDLPALIVGVALCTVALGLGAFALLGRRISNVDLPLAAAFAAVYGFRLIVRTPSIIMMLGDPAWLHYLHADLEYLVVVPAVILFERFFGPRLFWLNRIVSVVFIALAIVAISYEIATGHPGSLHALHNAFVNGFLTIYVLNIAMPAPRESEDWQLMRVATAIFALFVINAHVNLVSDRYGFTSEPVGFLIFTGAIVFTLIRHSVRTQMRVASVDGELAAARQIQMSILPKAPPRVRGLDIRAIYAPASEVAGDFYDFIELDERCAGILVADVSGHGVPAALVASMLKVALAGHAGFARQPARLLHEFNRFFCGKLERQFITAAYALIDGENVVVASAGHPAPLVARADRSIEELSVAGAIIGRFRAATFTERSAQLNAGDALVMYTDGVTEALNEAGEMWGEARFHEALARGASANEVLGAVKAWSKTLGDDVTLVAAKRV